MQSDNFISGMIKIKKEHLLKDAPELAGKTALVFAFPYYTQTALLCMGVYAQIPDYHIWVRKKLEAVASRLCEKNPYLELRAYVDNSPINEKLLALDAGIGVMGKNNLLITEKYGSYIFLGELVVMQGILEDFPDWLPNAEKAALNCEECGKCVRACPSGALDGRFNKEICVSRLTQKKGELSQKEQNLIKKSGFIWGCDRCQNVCPSNKVLQHVSFDGRLGKDFLNDIENLSNDEYKTKYGEYAFVWRGRETMLRNLRILFGEKR